MASPTTTPSFDLLRTTATDLRQALEAGSVTSVGIVEAYLDQIDQHNTRGAKCRAVISTPPRFQVICRAARLDRERAEGKLRSPLHGIPILLKDVFATDAALGMPTTAGASSLLDACPPRSAEVVDRILSAGLIILGKANMTEFAGQKGLPGWSAVGGMCQPAYIPSGYKLGEKPRGETSPSGSSTGSAVGVACGFAPIALGSETTGSIVSPSSVAALYSLKLTVGSIPMQGIFHLTRSFDTIGAMAKSPVEVAMTCDILAPRGGAAGPTLTEAATTAKNEELCVGFLDIEKWRLPKGSQDDDPKYFAQTAREYQEAMKRLQDNGVKVVEVEMTGWDEYMVGDINIDTLMDVIIARQAKNGIERSLQELEYSKVRTLQEVIKFNEQHADVEFDKDYCPRERDMGHLLDQAGPDDSSEMDEWLAQCKKWAAVEGIDKIVAEHGADVVVCCSDSFYAGVSVGSGYPMATVPLGYIASSGRPYALQAVTRAGEEWRLVKFMAVWERISPPRRVPDLEACVAARANL